MCGKKIPIYVHLHIHVYECIERGPKRHPPKQGLWRPQGRGMETGAYAGGHQFASVLFDSFIA